MFVCFSSSVLFIILTLDQPNNLTPHCFVVVVGGDGGACGINKTSLQLENVYRLFENWRRWDLFHMIFYCLRDRGITIVFNLETTRKKTY